MQFTQAKRLVIKIGSALLVEPESGEINHTWLKALIEDIAQCYQASQQVLIVTSGSIALGKRALHLRQATLPLEVSQAAAAVGQIRLAHGYQTLLADYDIPVAQVLLTLSDSESRQRYLNARNTLQSLLKLGVIPIINENDTVATAEIRYGDNDRLAARVAQMVSADVLVLLSDIDGLYDCDPNQNPAAKHIPHVNELTSETFAMASDAVSHVGSGGMQTKLQAAKIVMESGCHMVITNGYALHPLQRLQDGAKCTWFNPRTTPRRARKQWLAHHLQTQGVIEVDNGACAALNNGKSLLAAGIIDINGHFNKGDAVCIMNDKREIARGLVNYPATEMRLIMGKHSDAIPDVLGYHGANTIMHRDNMILLGRDEQ